MFYLRDQLSQIPFSWNQTKLEVINWTHGNGSLKPKNLSREEKWYWEVALLCQDYTSTRSMNITFAVKRWIHHKIMCGYYYTYLTKHSIFHPRFSVRFYWQKYCSAVQTNRSLKKTVVDKQKAVEVQHHSISVNLTVYRCKWGYDASKCM